MFDANVVRQQATTTVEVVGAVDIGSHDAAGDRKPFPGRGAPVPAEELADTFEFEPPLT